MKSGARETGRGGIGLEALYAQFARDKTRRAPQIADPHHQVELLIGQVDEAIVEADVERQRGMMARQVVRGRYQPLPSKSAS